MKRIAWVLAGVGVAAGLGFAGWTARGWRDDAASAAARAANAERLQEAAVAHQRDTAQLRAQIRGILARSDSHATVGRQAAVVAATYRRRADSLRAAVARAQTPGDSLPLLVDQVATLERSNDSLTIAYQQAELGRQALRDSLPQLVDTAVAVERRLAAAREASLEQLNRDLQRDLAKALGRGKFLGLVRIPDEVKLVVAAGVGFCAGSSKC